MDIQTLFRDDILLKVIGEVYYTVNVNIRFCFRFEYKGWYVLVKCWADLIDGRVRTKFYLSSIKYNQENQEF